MLIPYGTDAPTYHFPFASIAIIVVNVGLFLMTGMGDYETYSWLTLEFNRINPLQWVTSAFMHASWSHLIGNMIFLWCFGLVVEGKLGWISFFKLYLCLTLADGAISQVPMFVLVGNGAALGASGVIFALIAIALVWAPASEMHCLLPWSFYYIRQIDVPIGALAVFYAVVELIPLLLYGFSMSTPMLHLMGMVVGFPIGVYMLKKGLVDCEGWDLISRYNLGHRSGVSLNPLSIFTGLFQSKTRREEAKLLATAFSSRDGSDAVFEVQANAQDNRINQIATKEQQRLAVESLRSAIRFENVAVACAIYRKLQKNRHVRLVDDQTMTHYVRLLSKNGRHGDCIEPLQSLVARESPLADRAKRRIAAIQQRL